MACAAISVRGLPVPWNHEQKILHFLHVYRSQPFIHGATALALKLIPLRSRVLYPTDPELLARDVITGAEAQEIVARVEGLFPLVQRTIST